MCKKNKNKDRGSWRVFVALELNSSKGHRLSSAQSNLLDRSEKERARDKQGSVIPFLRYPGRRRL